MRCQRHHINRLFLRHFLFHHRTVNLSLGDIPVGRAGDPDIAVAAAGQEILRRNVIELEFVYALQRCSNVHPCGAVCRPLDKRTVHASQILRIVLSAGTGLKPEFRRQNRFALAEINSKCIAAGQIAESTVISVKQLLGLIFCGSVSAPSAAAGRHAGRQLVHIQLLRFLGSIDQNRIRFGLYGHAVALPL